ncbi:helix-turn-helix domain-containing protein [Skermanella aerolata]|uniref:helix-turn-helix domain-containing protein n=1 Tax=Skermanella aerolata TaxID=393310 RepID=UPI003D2571E3
MQRQRRKLTVEDRVAIDLRRKDGWGVRAIARELGRSPGAGRGGSAVGPVGTSGKAGAGQPAVCRGGEAAAAAVVAGADCRAAQAPGGWNGSVVRTTSVARGDLPGDLCRAAR